MAQAAAICAPLIERVEAQDHQSETGAIRHLRTLAAAVLNSELPWQEFRCALVGVAPSSRRALWEIMWPNPVNGVQVPTKLLLPLVAPL